MRITSELSFSEMVKNEICSSKEFSHHELKSIFLAILKNSGDYLLFEESIEIKTRYMFLVTFINKLCLQFYPQVSVEIAKSNIRTLKDKKNQFLVKIQLNNSSLWSDLNEYFNNQNIKDNETTIGILTGFFLTTGSVANPYKNSYHLEFRFQDIDLQQLCIKLIRNFHLEPKTIEHKKKHVVYFKKSEAISDILKIFKANECMYFLEDMRIEHDLMSNMQRLINLEVSNIDKITKANVEMVDKCKFIKSNFRFQQLKPREKLYVTTRINFPHHNMNQICEEMNKHLPDQEKITKGSLSHIIKKIRELYDADLFDF